MRHGTISCYVHRRCRCADCRAANTAEKRRRDSIRRTLLNRGEAQPTHGKLGTYSNWGCRCDECRTAWSAKNAAYKAKRAS